MGGKKLEGANVDSSFKVARDGGRRARGHKRAVRDSSADGKRRWRGLSTEERGLIGE